MKKLLSLTFFLMCSSGLLAQKKTFRTVKAGQNMMDVLSAAEVFHYPDFTSGTVFFLDGTRSEARLNYSRLADEMHFINPKGDTLAVANEQTIKFIVIGNDTFYYDQGYLRQVASGARVKLVLRQVWLVSDARQVASYHAATKSVFADYLASFRQGGRLYDLTVHADVVLTKEEQYYFGDHYGRFVPAGKKNLLLLFPKEQGRIERYLKENRISFSEKEDLEKILRLIESL